MIIFGEALHDFLFRWLAIIAVITMIVLSPFLIQRLKPNLYKGFLKAFGEAQRSPKRALMLPLGMLIGLGLVVGFSVIVNLLF